jgi:beta-mannosidase
VRLHAELDSLASRGALVRTFVDGVLVRADEHTLAAGSNSLDWAIDIDNPRLWWPWQLGEAALTDIAVEVQVDGIASDSVSRRTGLRQVAHDNWIFTINGERLYTRGIAVGPTALRMADCSPEMIANDVTLARELGMNLVRPLAHVARQEFYDAADAAGMLVWQDVPLYGAYARSVRRQAVRQARAMVDQLAHHPSIVLWCAHNQPTQPDPLHQQLPTWTRSVLDAWVRKALSDADDSRPVTAHSGILPHFPNIKSWPQLDWDTVSERFGMQRDAFERFVPASEHPNYASWATATQEYQAELLKHHIEALRRIKYSPNGGFCFLMLADAQPCIGYGIYDHSRVPKRAVEVVRAACAEVIVTAEVPSEHALGTEFVTEIHVVSDLPDAITEATVTATLTWSSGTRSWAWEGPVEADVCAKVGSIALVISTAGDARLDLHLNGAGVDARNSYEFVVR